MKSMHFIISENSDANPAGSNYKNDFNSIGSVEIPSGLPDNRDIEPIIEARRGESKY